MVQATTVECGVVVRAFSRTKLSAPILIAGLLLMTSSCKDEGTGDSLNSQGTDSTTGSGPNTSADANGTGTQPPGTGTDGSSPLAGSLSDFCDGEGTVVTVGAEQDCVDQIAEDTFRYALCACDSITARSQLLVDAFDSRSGAYGVLTSSGTPNVSQDGNVGLNGQLNFDGKLDVQGSLFVGGGGISLGASSNVSTNLYAAGTATQARASSSVGRNAYIDGNIIGRYNIGGNLSVPIGASVSNATINGVGGTLTRTDIPAVEPCSCAEDKKLDIAALTAWGRENNDNEVENAVTSTTWADGQGPNIISLPCGRYYLTKISHPGTLTIRAEGRTVLFIDGDVEIGGGANFEISDDSEIDIFIAGKLSVQASASFGNPSYPSRVRTYVGGTGDISLSAASSFGGNLYAPNSDIIFGASAEIYGAIFANSVSFSGSARIHFDTSVRYSEDDCDEPTETPDSGVNMSLPDANQNDSGANNPPDSGEPIECMSCGDCPSTEACVIPEGATSGQCGACATDLDCCPPASCFGGVCLIDI